MSADSLTFDIKLEQLQDYQFKVEFDREYEHELITDESGPLGKDIGPSPARMLAVSIGNCLASSLVYCLSRKGEKVEGLVATVHLEVVRNEQKRLRVGKIDVTLKAPVGRESKALQDCLDTFEDFCTITQSVRAGINVNVNVEAVG